ncbi:MAG TPA: YopX family protein [Salinimicrobium sp.]|nr:YopX family protein [Salinimicrobium sp.]
MEQRTIKFRAIRKNTNELVYGNLFIPDKFVGGVYICPACTYADFMPGFEDGENIEEFKNSGIALGHFHEVNPESVGQFTGFTDKNGKEIYEGDILSDWTETDEGNIQSKMQVFWCEKTGAWKLDNSYKQDRSSGDLLSDELTDFAYEITGNIFKN